MRFEEATVPSESSTEEFEVLDVAFETDDEEFPDDAGELEESVPVVAGRAAPPLEEASAAGVVVLAVELSDEEAGVAGSSRDFRERTATCGWRKEVSEERTRRLQRDKRVIKSIGSFILVVLK